jgi:transcriptional regulator with XRE-family HTH domain
MGLIERGERGATAVTLEKLSLAFSCKIDTLFLEPEKESLRLREERDGNIAANRRKITNLVTRLNEPDTEFVIHVINGLLKHHLSRGSKTQDNFE